MVNGTLAHADETDDTLAPGPWHPGCNVVPAALALGEQFGASGARLRARRRARLRHRHARDGGHPARSADRPQAAVRHCAACSAPRRGRRPGRLRSAEDAMGALVRGAAELRASKPSRAIPITSRRDSSSAACPRAAASPPSCSCTAAGPPSTMRWSGPESFVTAQAPTGKAELLVDRLGERYEITRANIKRWTVGFPIHAPLDAIEALLKRQPIDPEQVTELVVRYQPGSITDNSGPSDINVQHALAVMLIDKRLTFRSVHDTARMRDPAVVRLRGKDASGPAPPAAPVRAAAPAVHDGGWQPHRAGRRRARCSARPPIRCRASSWWPSAASLMSPVLGAAQTGRSDRSGA